MWVIVFAQFAGTSLWFAGNAVLYGLIRAFELPEGAVGDLTSAVQFGFISGTLVYAVATLADRFSPSKIFFISSLLGSFFNILILWAPFGQESLWLYRFLTGFFLAGIYPVGMKLAADWYKQELGKALGFLVGALVLGTGFPHLISAMGANLHWSFVLVVVSILSVLGGILVLIFVPDGPNRTRGIKFRLNALPEIFKVKNFRLASFGYFGHMWELYAFWAFVPVILQYYDDVHDLIELNVSLWSFIIIAVGFFGCSVGGIFALKKGSAWIAFVQLSISLLCCVISPLIIGLHQVIFLSVLVIWGITVVGDSPQYSTLTAHTAPKSWIGSALTIMNCIGFGLTIISIQIVKMFEIHYGIQYAFLILIPGPLLGLRSLYPLLRVKII